MVPIKYSKSDVLNASIYIRPYARQILETLKPHFEIVLFTASHPCYANTIIDLIDPNNQLITFRLFRDSCVKTDEGVYIKDLRILANRSLKDIALIDNAAYSYGFQPSNGIPILPFYHDKSDKQLKVLTEFLLKLKDAADFRPIIRQKFHLAVFEKYASKFELFKLMFLKEAEKRTDSKAIKIIN